MKHKTISPRATDASEARSNAPLAGGAVRLDSSEKHHKKTKKLRETLDIAQIRAMVYLMKTGASPAKNKQKKIMKTKTQTGNEIENLVQKYTANASIFDEYINPDGIVDFDKISVAERESLARAVIEMNA